MTPAAPSRRAVLQTGASFALVSGCSFFQGPPPQTPPANPHYFTKTEVRFRSGLLELAGTLYRPEGVLRAPGVVFGHGSGDVARPNRRFSFEAEGLAARGVASLVFDKRGSGRSDGDWRTSDFHDLAADMRAAFAFMRAQDGINPDQVGMRGASQAGWVMPISASEAPQPAFMILISVAMITPGEQIAFEAETAIESADLTAAEKSEALALTRRALECARTGEGLDAYFARVREVSKERWYRASPTPGERDRWFFDWLHPIFDVDPTSPFKALNMPILAYFGERDTLVPTRLARQRLEALYQDDRAPLLTVIEFPGAGHDLRYGNDAGERVLDLDYLNGMAAWIETASSAARTESRAP